MNVLDLASRKVNLRKVSGTNGGEWQGPCPGCGGTDRFHVWPAQNEGKGAYWCRSCEKCGDNIQYLRDFEGMGYRQACEYLGEKVSETSENHTISMPKKAEKPPFSPEIHTEPAEIWQERVDKFLTWSQECLQKNAEVLQWLADRGINQETSINYRLGWNPGEKGKDIYRARKAWGLPEEFNEDGRPRAFCIPRGLVIPYIIDGIVHRIRIRRPEEHRTKKWPTPYHLVTGSSMSTMILESGRRAFVVIESELDGIAVAAGNNLAGAVALGSVSAKPDSYTFTVLQGALQILNALDYDAAGAKAMSWWTDQFPQCDRWPVPRGKDPGEAVKLGIDLNSWIKAGLPPALTIEDGTVGKKGAALSGRPTPPAATSIDGADIPAPIRELLQLLRNNSGVQIVNSAQHYTVLRQGKFVGGRINELVFLVQESRDYLLNHPAEIIDSTNLIYQWKRPN